MNSKYTQLPFLPDTRLEQVAQGITLAHPLSRRGYGPGFLVVVPTTGTTSSDALRIERGIPSPLMKWAEESFVVVEITEAALDAVADPIGVALAALAACASTKPEDSGVGLIAYAPELWNRIASTLDSFPQIKGAAVYGDLPSAQTLAPASLPLVQHLTGKETHLLSRTADLTACSYPAVTSALFAVPFQDTFDYSAEGISHTRNLTFFKKLLDGPYFDLEAIWDEHTYYEFENRSLECTMATMVQEPYVNHVPTLTGGIGRAKLTLFYRDHFIFHNPEDAETVLISRSTGIDRVIDEFLFKCTHNSQMDWLVPGIPATGRQLNIPMNAVVNIRGDRLYHEHISWDQGTVLKQLGLLPDYLPYPHPVQDEQLSASGGRLEYRVPVMGEETARKLEDKDAIESNTMFTYQIRQG
ncbi:related to dienelactone hydrolase and related enzymes [Cephalotrichum gorgonifer]|uniref:Related to dienelactone hydrolase and related enzymes n=1 Tax=Cephalotrichum gorgonifer TaxID=2041049 RepID=A0AAE8N2V2_9PEZI|nr:related to dienelactone hydrolase and related enzymes [Cephalotrichum gorgonifer]